MSISMSPEMKAATSRDLAISLDVLNLSRLNEKDFNSDVQQISEMASSLLMHPGCRNDQTIGPILFDLVPLNQFRDRADVIKTVDKAIELLKPRVSLSSS